MIALALAATLALTAATPAPTPRSPRPALRAASTHVLPFIQNDFPRAVALAKARKLPLFVEAWAPW